MTPKIACTQFSVTVKLNQRLAIKKGCHMAAHIVEANKKINWRKQESR